MMVLEELVPRKFLPELQDIILSQYPETRTVTELDRTLVTDELLTKLIQYSWLRDNNPPDDEIVEATRYALAEKVANILLKQ